jgi:hypothetical protein
MSDVDIFIEETGAPIFLTLGDGASSFLGLLDSPSSYSGKAGYLVAVSGNERSVTFIYPPSSTLFSGLLDVSFTNLTSGDLPQYNGSQWVNIPSDFGPENLEDLLDVSITSPASGDFLSYNGSQWINQPLKVNGGVLSIPTGNRLLQYSGAGLSGSPEFFSLSVIKPSGQPNLSVNLLDGTSSSDGFWAELGATLSVTGYKLAYVPIY